MFSLSCVIHSHSHFLEDKAFAVLMREEAATQVTKVTKAQIEATIKATKENFRTIEDFFPTAHLIASNFIMSLNIASLGHFTWVAGNQLYPTYDVDPIDKSKRIVLSAEPTFPSEERYLTESEVRQAAIIYGSILREIDQNIRQEYVKGILHLGLSFGDINFNKEAFGNFYRSFEYFVTRKILQVKKLKNEEKELTKAIKSAGLSKEVVEEFNGLYRIRSEQVMHAQRPQVEITQDDVLKMKVFTDFLLHRHYTAIANKWLEDRHGIANLGVDSDAANSAAQVTP